MPGNSHARFAGRRRKTIAGDRVTADGRRPYDDVVGPKSRWNPDPAAVRHGHEAGRSRWAAAALRFSAPGPGTSTASQRCRLRPMSPSPIATRPPERCWSQTLASVSRRQYRRTREPVGEAIETWASSTSKTAMSRRLVEGISCSGFRPRSTRSDSSAFAAVAFSVLLPKSPGPHGHMRWAWREIDYPRMLEQPTRRADEVEHAHPQRKTMQETLTVIQRELKVSQRLFGSYCRWG